MGYIGVPVYRLSRGREGIYGLYKDHGTENGSYEPVTSFKVSALLWVIKTSYWVKTTKGRTSRVQAGTLRETTKLYAVGVMVVPAPGATLQRSWHRAHNSRQLLSTCPTLYP